MSNTCSVRGHSCLSPDFSRKAFSSSSFEYVSYERVHTGPLYFELYSLYTQFVGNFYHERTLNFVKCRFLHLLRELDNFMLHFINVMPQIYWFAYVEPSLYARDRSHLIMMYDPCNTLLNSVCWDFVRNFRIYIRQGWWPLVFFSCNVLIWLCIWMMLAL